MKHINYSTLLSYIKGELKHNDDDAIKLHVMQCQLCANNLKALGMITKNQRQYSPSPKILSNILDYYHQSLLTKSTFFDTFKAFIALHRRVLALATIIIAAGIALVLLSYRSNPITIPHVLYMADKSGHYIKSDTIKEGRRITIPETKWAMLVANNDIVFQLAGGVDMVIMRSHYSKNAGTKKFHYSLEKGAINIKTNHHHTSMHYEVKTPDANIQPLGTEFYINVSPEGTHIYIVEGKVLLTNTATKVTIETEVGKLYTISQTQISSFDIEKYSLQWINDIDARFNNVAITDEDLGSSSILTSDVNNNETTTYQSQIDNTEKSNTQSSALNSQDKEDKGNAKEMRNDMKHDEIKVMRKEAKQKHR